MLISTKLQEAISRLFQVKDVDSVKGLCAYNSQPAAAFSKLQDAFLHKHKIADTLSNTVAAFRR